MATASRVRRLSVSARTALLRQTCAQPIIQVALPANGWTLRGTGWDVFLLLLIGQQAPDLFLGPVIDDPYGGDPVAFRDRILAPKVADLLVLAVQYPAHLGSLYLIEGQNSGQPCGTTFPADLRHLARGRRLRHSRPGCRHLR